jgi:hypothetical protein
VVVRPASGRHVSRIAGLGIGILYISPLAIVGIAHDFRYVYWGIGACCVASILAADAWTLSGQDLGHERVDALRNGEAGREPGRLDPRRLDEERVHAVAADHEVGE